MYTRWPSWPLHRQNRHQDGLLYWEGRCYELAPILKSREEDDVVERSKCPPSVSQYPVGVHSGWVYWMAGEFNMRIYWRGATFKWREKERLAAAAAIRNSRSYTGRNSERSTKKGRHGLKAGPHLPQPYESEKKASSRNSISVPSQPHPSITLGISLFDRPQSTSESLDNPRHRNHG